MKNNFTVKDSEKGEDYAKIVCDGKVCMFEQMNSPSEKSNSKRFNEEVVI